jgi:Na+/H+ antiporter NhaD/arsenite permease-like protein
VIRLLLPALLIASPSIALASDSPGVPPVDPLMAIPFVLLLLTIAVAPVVNRHLWEKHYPLVAFGLAIIPLVYYLAVLRAPARVIHTGFEYVSFIALIGSLFVVAGGIHIRVRGRSTPAANVALLGIGAVVANILGTTGASMILIRPFIRVNRYRIRPFHVVFFIFIVSNMGGALTPIGDPPLFLGYLKGIPFFWVAGALWFKWLVGTALVLGIFYVLDLRAFRALSKGVRHGVEEGHEEGEVSGLQNVVFLVIILVAVFITDPPYVREAMMIGAAVGSYLTTPRSIYEKNDFTFIPIKEVAILFFGIFATMIPALDWLEHNAGVIGINTPGQFYWATGVLSSVLDNAPTYLNFLSAEIGLFVDPSVVGGVQQLVASGEGALADLAGPKAELVKSTYLTLVQYHFSDVAARTVSFDQITTSYLIANHSLHVEAISLAAVFFGAFTYIGNGPNFMVKSIADHAGVKTPTFTGYIVVYALPVLIPVFALLWFLFFRS